jgi:prepilin-type N-terminal cleavage/methylation domain-containing protein
MVYDRQRREGGFSLFEMLIVVGVIAIAAGISIPQVIGARRLIRSAGVTHELSGALRDARQMAISRRRAVTFQYDDDTKRVNLIDHGVNTQGLGVSGPGVLTAGNYPYAAGSSVASTVMLGAGGATADEMAYGVPSTVPTAARTLGDKTTLSALTTDKKLNITFQPNGTIVGDNGLPRDFALAVYNSAQPHETAAAISILGATGRIKSWRYSESAQKFVE